MVLFQNSSLLVYHAVTALSRDIRITPDFLARVSYNIPIVSLLTHSAFLLSPSLSSQLQQLTPSSPRPQTLANPLFYQDVIQAIFVRFKPILAAMATIDNVPEVCLQISTLQASAATPYFFPSQIYFVWFLGNEEWNLDSISYYSLSDRSYHRKGIVSHFTCSFYCKLIRSF